MITNEITVDHFDRALKNSVSRVVLGQVSVGSSIAEVVDGDHFEFVRQVVFMDGAHDVAANASISVDCNFDSHY